MSLYEYMNWPVIEGLVYAECDSPFDILGKKSCREGSLIQAFRPDAVEMSVEVEGVKKHYTMEKVDEAGYFAVIIPGKKKAGYKLISENIRGRKNKYSDPYAYKTELPSAVKKFIAGTAKDAGSVLGCKREEIDGVIGYRFLVWAPNARRVSVVGEFNSWDERLCMMQKDKNTGIFCLFIPDIDISEGYMYDIMQKDGKTVRKLDPFGAVKLINDKMVSVYSEDKAFDWSDNEWLEYQRQLMHDYKNDKELNSKRPLAICEINASELCEENIVEKIKKLGFNYVQLSEVLASANDSGEHSVTAFYSITARIEENRLKEVINRFHHNNIGVIVNWNCSMVSPIEEGLYKYDGTCLYDTVLLNIPGKNECVAGLDYTKPQVRSFLMSSIHRLIEEYHVDGIKISEVSSMLYLDYGKNAGEWQPNIYGGHENLEAVSFLKDIRRYLDKSDRKILFIAHEDSLWPCVTGTENDGLGFDYKWNMGWKKDMKAFINNDPLFRKGYYDRLSASMLYQYSDEFIMEMSEEHPLFENGDIGLEHIEDLNCVLVYMYTHPGKKLVSYKLADMLKDHVSMLNRIYFDNKELYVSDGEPDSFAWIDNSSADETVIAYERSCGDEKVLTVINFTPVMRETFLLGIDKPGKYISLINGKKYASGAIQHKGCEDSVSIDIEPRGADIYRYMPYTGDEVKAIELKKQAEALRLEAQKKKEIAKEMTEKADELEQYYEEIKVKLETARESARLATLDAKEAENAAKQKNTVAKRACKKADMAEL